MERILTGEEKCPLIFIEDDIQSKRHSVTLLKEFTKSLSQRCDLVYFLCFDKSCSQWKQMFNYNKEGKQPIYIDTRNYLQWDQSAVESNENLALNCESDIMNEILSDASKQCISADAQIGLVCDDCGPLISSNGLSSFCRFLSNMIYQSSESKAKFTQIVMVTHGDCTSDLISNCLFYQSKAYIKLNEMVNSSNEKGLFQCRLQLKRLSGKYSDEIITMKYIPSIGLRQIKQSAKPIKIEEESSSQEADPAANLSFNLSLTESEKEARSKIRLPYTYTQDRQDEHLQRSQNEGKVFYQPDEADDYDEEDPDDDLNI